MRPWREMTATSPLGVEGPLGGISVSSIGIRGADEREPDDTAEPDTSFKLAGPLEQMGTGAGMPRRPCVASGAGFIRSPGASPGPRLWMKGLSSSSTPASRAEERSGPQHPTDSTLPMLVARACRLRATPSVPRLSLLWTRFVIYTA